MRNKWSGRDELAEHLLRTLLGGEAASAHRPAATRPPARQWAGLVFYGNE